MKKRKYDIYFTVAIVSTVLISLVQSSSDIS